MNHIIKMSAIAVLVASGGIGNLLAAEAITFDAKMKIEAEQNCRLNASAIGKTAWNPDWNIQEGSTTEGTLTRGVNDSAEPLLVKITSSSESGGACDLDGFSISANVQNGTQVGDAWKVATSKSDGFWRYMPVLTKVTMYSDLETNNEIENKNISITDAEKNNIIINTSPVTTSMSRVENVDDFDAKPAISLTDSYINPASLNKTYSVTSTSAAKGAIVGVGSILAQDPENAKGMRDISVVNGDEIVRMPFSLVVTSK